MDFKINGLRQTEVVGDGVKTEQNKKVVQPKVSFNTGINDGMHSDLINGIESFSLSDMQKISASKAGQKQLYARDFVSYYRQGHSAEETYEHFKETLSDLAKNNPENFKTLVNSMLNFEGQHYDYDMPYQKIGDNQAEILEKFLTADGEVDNAICTTIHGFMMDTLTELGISASLACGTRGGGHATLIYQLEDGKYIFNDYGSSSEVEADNVVEALQKITKTNKFDSWGGYTVLVGQGSEYYQQYALENEAAYGDEIDSKKINKDTAFTRSDINGQNGISAAYHSDEDTMKLDLKGQYTNEDGDFKASAGFQYRQSGATNNFFASSSFGAKLEAEKDFEIGENGALSVDADVIANSTTGSTAFGPRKNIVLKEGAGVAYQNNITETDDSTLSNSVKLSQEGSLVIADNLTSFTDVKFTLEDGLKFDREVDDNLTFSALVNAGVMLTSGISDYANQEYTFNLGGKGNLGADVKYNIDDDSSVKVSAKAFVAGNKNFLNYGAGGEITYRREFFNPSAVYQNSALELGVGYSMNMTDISVGGFSEKVQNEQNITARALFDLGEKLNFYGDYNYEVMSKKSLFTLGAKYNFD